MVKNKKSDKEEMKAKGPSTEQNTHKAETNEKKEPAQTVREEEQEVTAEQAKNMGQEDRLPEDKDDSQSAQEEDERAEENDTELLLAEKIREQENKYLRLAAEFDNYRKRTLREKAELTKAAGADIIYDLLPVIDDLDRAVEAMAGAEDVKAVRKGVELIHSKYRENLYQKGVKEIKATGTEFNTDLHEAITKIHAPSKKDKGKVIDVTEKGYLLNDRVIRYAKVIVGE